MSAYDGIHTLADSFRKLFEQDATNCTETLLGVKDQNPVGFFDSAAESIGTQVQLQAEADTAYPTQIERIEHKCRAYGLTVPPHISSMTKVQAADILHLLPGWHGGHPENLRRDYDNLIALQTGIPVAPAKREDRLTDNISVNLNGRISKIRSVLREG